MVAYAFKDNIAGGGRFMYNRNLTKINSVDITINEDTGFNVENMYSLSHNWGGTFFHRNYISLNNNRRFGLYNEIQVTMQKGRSKIINGEGDDLTGTFEKSTEVGIGLSPGLVAFVNNYMAVEVGVGVLGLNFNKVRQVTDQVYVGERSYNKANFKINLFAISLGLVFYL